MITLYGDPMIKTDSGPRIDTGADICALNTVDIGKIPIGVNLQPDNIILEGYGPGTIRNLGVTDFKVTYKEKSIQTQFNVIDRKAFNTRMCPSTGIGNHNSEHSQLTVCNTDNQQSS